MKTYVIEREMPGVGGLSTEDLSGAAKTSNAALASLAPSVEWVHSYVTGDKTFCIYRAENEAVVHDHARMSGFPANRVTEVTGMIDPMTARR